MTSSYTPQSSTTFTTLHNHLKTFPTPLLPPGKPHDKTLTNKISSLYIHPSLEAILHILNGDLPSAHFLVRHMQAAPAVEGMYIHGLLHRVEGDYNNARAWYSDVCEEEAFTNYWGAVPEDPNDDTSTLEDTTNSLETKKEEKRGRIEKSKEGYYTHTSTSQKVPAQPAARKFLNEIEQLNKHKKGDKGALSEQSREEINALVKWCVDKFGTEQVTDARTVWVQPGEEHRKMGESMVSGGEGFRKF